jgi:hypothetical protein
VAVSEAITHCTFLIVYIEIHLFYLEDIIIGLNKVMSVRQPLVQPIKTLIGLGEKPTGLSFG